MNQQSSFKRIAAVIRFMVVISLLASLLAVQPANVARAAAPVLIDHFEQIQTSTINSVGVSPISALQVLDGTVLGGWRQLRTEITDTGGSGSLTLSTGTIVSRLSHSTDTGVYGISTITYDGTDGSGGLQPSGLGTVDLTNNGQDNALILELNTDDIQANISIRLYQSNSTTCSIATITTPGNMSSNAMPRALVYRFSDFAIDTGNSCTSAPSAGSVGAIQILIDTTGTDATDLSFHIFESGKLDYGDLPSTGPNYSLITLYDASLPVSGAGHVFSDASTLRIGANIDAENNGQPTPKAWGDDPNGVPDDEDGVVKSPSDLIAWTPGSTGHGLDVTTSGTGCLYAWIDWNNNGIFEINNTPTNEQVLYQQAVSGNNVVTTIPIAVPAGAVGTAWFSRFRLFDRYPDTGTCKLTALTRLAPNGQFVEGEVEDHWLDQGTPTAVTLNSLQAQPATTSPVLPLALVGGAAAILLGAVLFTRKSRKQSV
jgi:hypothetical protein